MALQEVGSAVYFALAFLMSLLIALISASVLQLETLTAATIAVLAGITVFIAWFAFKEKGWPFLQYRQNIFKIVSHSAVLVEGVFAAVVFLTFVLLLLGGGMVSASELYAFVKSANLANLLFCTLGLAPTLWSVASKA